MADKTENQSAFEIGAAQNIEIKEYNGIPFSAVPDGLSLKFHEDIMDQPTRIKRRIEFQTSTSFADYFKVHKSEQTTVLVDQKKHAFKAIFDDHAKGKPGWAQHTATLKTGFAHEWKALYAMNQITMTALEFAEFIEDNLSYIIEPVSGADLLSMAQSYKVNFRGELQVEDTMHNGLRNLVIKDQSVARGTTTAGATIQFPESMTFALRIFSGYNPYKIPAYLRYRDSKDKIIFFFKISDVEGMLEKAFKKAVEEVQDLIDTEIYYADISG